MIAKVRVTGDTRVIGIKMISPKIAINNSANRKSVKITTTKIQTGAKPGMRTPAAEKKKVATTYKGDARKLSPIHKGDSQHIAGKKYTYNA